MPLAGAPVRKCRDIMRERAGPRKSGAVRGRESGHSTHVAAHSQAVSGDVDLHLCSPPMPRAAVLGPPVSLSAIRDTAALEPYGLRGLSLAQPGAAA